MRGAKLSFDKEKAEEGYLAPNANLTGANLTDAILRGADLTDANFTNAKITNAQLASAKLCRTIKNKDNDNEKILSKYCKSYSLSSTSTFPPRQLLGSR